MADDLDKNLEEQQKRLAELRQEINKLTKTALSKQQRQLQKLRREYAEQSKKVQELTKRTRDLRIEKTQLTRAAEQLTSKFGGTAAAVTKFTGGMKDSIFTANEATGKMKIFGQQTAMTSAKFAGYAAAIQLAIAATMAFLEWIDRAEIKQGKLQRALGSTDVSIAASVKARAAGYKVAGEAGAKAAEDMVNRIARARRGLFVEYGAGVGGGDFERLTQLTAGMSEQIPQWLTMLTETFAMGAGTEGSDQILKTFEHLGQIAHESNVPIEMFCNMVFDLAKEFVALGVDVKDATDAITIFADEMGRSVITPAVGMAVMRNVFQQQRTAVGLQGRLMTAAFSAQVFDSLGEDVKDMLNITAVKMTGDKRATWESLDIAQQAEALRTMEPGPYVDVQKGLYEWLKNQGELVAMATSRKVLGVEWSTAKKFWEEKEPGLAPKEAAEKLREAQKTGTEQFTTAVDNFNKYVSAAAENQKEFTAGMHEVVERMKAAFLVPTKEAKGKGITALAGAIGQGTVGAIAEMPKKAQIIAGISPSTMVGPLGPLLPIIGAFSELFAGEGAAATATSTRTAGVLGEIGAGNGTELETPEGVFKITYEGPPRGVEGKSSTDASGVIPRGRGLVD